MDEIKASEFPDEIFICDHDASGDAAYHKSLEALMDEVDPEDIPIYCASYKLVKVLKVQRVHKLDVQEVNS
jgi:hypothetical protein